MLLRKRTILIVSLLSLCFSIHPTNAQENKDVLGSLRFRHIGPVGNRLTSVVGIPDQPNIYYVGGHQVEFGRLSTAVFIGNRSSMANRSHRSVRWPSLPLIQRSFGRAAVSRGFEVTSQWAREFTNRQTRARRGH